MIVMAFTQALFITVVVSALLIGITVLMAWLFATAMDFLEGN